MNRSEYDFQVRKQSYELAKKCGLEVAFDAELESAIRADKSSLVEIEYRIDSADSTPRNDANEATMQKVRSNYETPRHRRAKSTAKPKARTDAADSGRTALAPSGYYIAGSGYLY